jgi:hypothetical protein
MAENQKLFRTNIFFGLAAETAFADYKAPTTEELNNWFALTAVPASGPSPAMGPQGLVHNITCALSEDGTEYSLDDPETDDTLSYCDQSGTQTAGLQNATVAFAAFRDADRSATGVYNEALELLFKPGIKYWAIKRVGKNSNEKFEIGDKVRLLSVETDYPTDTVDATAATTILNTMLFKGGVNWNYTLVA